MAGLMIIPAVFAFSWRRSGHTAGWFGADVHHDSESICKHGIRNTGRNPVLCLGTLCSTDKLYCSDRECSFYFPGWAEMEPQEINRSCRSHHDNSRKPFSGIWPLGFVKIIGMQFLDFFDFLTNSVMMPIAAIATCLLVSRVIGVKRIEKEVLLEESTFRRKNIFNFMIQYLCPIFAAIILISSVANAFGCGLPTGRDHWSRLNFYTFGW